MITNNRLNNQLPKEVKAIFDELEILKYLRKVGINKGFGYSCAYLFQLVFSLVFEGKNLFRLLQSKKAKDLPEKNAIYRFLNNPQYNWRRFLLVLSTFTIIR